MSRVDEVLNGMLQHYKARWDRMQTDEKFDETLPDLDWVEAKQAIQTLIDQARIDEVNHWRDNLPMELEIFDWFTRRMNELKENKE